MFLFGFNFCPPNNLVQFCTHRGLGGNGGRDYFPPMEKQICVKKLKASPSPESLANMSLWGNSGSLGAEKDKEVAVWLLREVCAKHQVKATRTGLTCLLARLAFRTEPDRLWEPLTCPLHQISIFHLTLLLWQRPQATGPGLGWPTQPNPETQKAHLRPQVLTCLRSVGVSFCLSHLLIYLHQAIWVTSRRPRSEVQETSQDMDTEVRVGMER